MRKMILTAAVLAFVVSASAAFAEDAAAPADAGKATQEKLEKRGEKFAEHKAKILDNLKKKEACVEAAKDREAMHACFPNFGKWGHRGGGKAEGGQQRAGNNKE